MRLTAKEVDERRVVARAHRWLRAHLLEVPHHRRPLPVDQHRDEQDQGEALAAPEPEGEDRPEQQRSHPGGVPAHRGLNQEGRRQGGAVGGDPVTEEALLRRQRDEDGDRHQDGRLIAREVEGLVAALGERRRDQHGDADGDHGELEAPAAALRDRVGDHPAGQEQGRDRARQGRRRSEQDRQPAVTPLGRQDRTERHGHAEGEGQAPGEQADRRSGCEPDHAETGALSEAPVRDRGEEQCRCNGRQNPHQPWPDQAPEDGQQNAVAGQMVAAEPAVVPGDETLVREQVRPIDLGGVIGAVGLDDQIRHAEGGGHQARLAIAPEHVSGAQAVAGRQDQAAGRTRARTCRAVTADSAATSRPKAPSTQK